MEMTILQAKQKLHEKWMELTKDGTDEEMMQALSIADNVLGNYDESLNTDTASMLAEMLAEIYEQQVKENDSVDIGVKFRVKQWLDHISTIKNDLAVDCVDRQKLLKIYEGRFTELQKLKRLKDNKGTEDRQLGVNYCINILKEMPPATPQVPRCKNCKYWKDSDGKYRRGCDAESKCPINTHEVYCGDGYCHMFSPKEDIEEEKKDDTDN